MTKRLKQILHDCLLPSERNNYRARTLHLSSFTYYLIIVVLFIVLYQTTFSASSAGQILGVATDITMNKLLELTNQERRKNHLPDLRYNPQLEKAAAEKAKHMFAYQYWAHYGPDGATPWDFILGSGYKYQYAGENLAKDFLFSDGVVKAWMTSPTHRDNILRRDYTDIGLAVVNGTLDNSPTTLVVQFFGAPFEPSTRGVLAAQGRYPSSQAINFKKTSYYASLLLFGFLFLVLLADLYWAYRLRLVRLTGKHLAHGIFLVIMIMAILMAAKGSIL